MYFNKSVVKKVTIIIPTYNEADSINYLLNSLEAEIKKIKNFQVRVLVVDDNSPDATATKVSQRVDFGKNVYILKREKKEGLGKAYFAGMEEAFSKHMADLVVVMDADLSHDPKYLPGFLREVQGGSGLVIGSRYIEGGSIAEGWKFHRKILSILGNIIVPILAQSSMVRDWTSGYRAITKETFDKVRPFILKNSPQLKGYTFNIAFVYYALLLKIKISEIPIRFIDRREGKSKLGFEYVYNTPMFLLSTRLGNLVQGILKKV